MLGAQPGQKTDGMSEKEKEEAVKARSEAEIEQGAVQDGLKSVQGLLGAARNASLDGTWSG